MLRNKFNLRIVVAMTICLAGMFLIVSCESSKNRLVKVSLEDKKYDVLYLIADTGDESLRIDGTSTDGYNWTFEISDSIFEITSYYQIRPEEKNLIAKNEADVHLINFRTIIENDTLRSGYFNFDTNKSVIDLKCKFDITVAIENTQYVEELDSTFVVQTIVTDIFLMELPENTYLRESMQTPMFSFFYDKKDPNKPYEVFLVEYAEKIKKNPNSLYYISFFSMAPDFYKSKEDYENLFNLFSPEMQNSRWGIIAKKSFAPF